jgi:hypothetical protein
LIWESHLEIALWIFSLVRATGGEAVDVSARQIRPVVDPALTRRTQWWLSCLIARRAQPADRLAIEFAGPVILVMCLIGALATGLQASWLGAAAVVAIGTFAAHREIPSGGLRRHSGHYVDPYELDSACWRPLHAAQRAIEFVLRSQVYRDGLLDHAARAADLRRHEWEIAVRLRDITTLRADYTGSMSEGPPGPQTAAVLSAHLRAITIAETAISRRVGELRRYAEEVLAADAALRDWQTAERVARRNDRYLDLVARTEADAHAIAEITYLTGQAVRTREAFQVTLDQAALAAQPLVFPDAERTREAEVIAS